VKPIRIFRHVNCENPGYLGEFLDARGTPWELACIDSERPVPQQIDDVSGLIFMGGAGSVNDDHDWIQHELSLIQRAYERDVPMMGICFGAQLMSKALGGDVVAGPAMEIGWHPLRRVNGCHCEGWLQGLPESIETFHWHLDTFSVPSGFTPLLQSCCFRNQAFVKDKHLAMQFHLEMTEKMLNGWIERYGSDLSPTSKCTQTREEITRDLESRLSNLRSIADVVYGHWLNRVLDS